MKLINSVFCLMLCVLWSHPQAAERFVYKHNEDRDLFMIITRPPGWTATDKRPALIFFYNGGWKEAGATKPQFQEQTNYFAARGMVVAQADYREKSAGGVTSDKCVADIFSAVRWLRNHANELGIDPGRIAAAGGSGSIHLPAAVFHVDAFNTAGEDSSIDPLPRALFSFHPDPDVLDHKMMQRLLEGGNPGTHPMPPTVVYWGSRDVLAPFLEEFVGKVQSINLPITSYVHEGGVHGFYKFTPGLEKSTEHMNNTLRSLGYLSDTPVVELPHKEAPAGYEERILETQQRWLERHNELAKERSAVDPQKEPIAPSRHIYKQIGERRLQIAMHYPPNWSPDDKRPAVLFFSGSHKVQADKNGKLPPLADERMKLGLPIINNEPGGNHHVPICDGFAERGYVCMRVEYRTRGKDGVLPGEDIADAFSAMRWVRSHSTRLGIDPQRIVAAGGSSGAYLAASLFAFADRHPDAQRKHISALPNAIVLYSPLVDWLEVGEMSENFLVVLNGDKELGARVSPARHWRKDCPPTLVMVGTEEPPFGTVKSFAETWISKGSPMELFVAEGREHGFFGKPDWIGKTLDRTEEFLKSSNFVPSRNWDGDEDGKISEIEFKAPKQLFQNMDLDGDGYLNGDELRKLDSKLDLAKIAETTWVVPPEKSYHGVEHRTYFSKSMQTEVGYNIYLPDSYNPGGKRFPVVYHLHGSGGNESSQIDLSTVYHKAIQQGKIAPVIIVFVNGGRRSYYSDNHQGTILSETTIIHELIPHIDTTYRTIPEKACRVLHGFSMGGFGTLKLGMKYPELFCAALSFSGGMASPDSMHMLFLKHIVGGNEESKKANNPADIALKNKEALNDLNLWLFTGTRDVAREDSEWAHQFLETNHIPHRFEISDDVGHALKRHFDLFGGDIFNLLMSHFKTSSIFNQNE